MLANNKKIVAGIAVLLLIILNIGLLLNLNSSDQKIRTWARTFGSEGEDLVNTVTKGKGDGFILAGRRKPQKGENPDIVVRKINENGKLYWKKIYGDHQFQQQGPITRAHGEGYIIAGGTTTSEGDRDIWLLKINNQGSIQWEKTFGGSGFEAAYDINQAADGDYLIAGETNSKGPDKSNMWLIKVDNKGDLQWDHVFGGDDKDDAYAVTQTSDRNYLLAGETKSYGNGQQDAWILKTNQKGEVQWRKTFGAERRDYASDITKSASNNFVITGALQESGKNIWAVKINTKGNVKWNKTYIKGMASDAYAITKTDHSGYVIAGSSMNKVNNKDMRVLKIGNSGELKWQKLYGSHYDDQASSIKLINEGGYIIAGKVTSTSNHQEDIGVLKTDASGAVPSTSIKKTPKNLVKKFIQNIGNNELKTAYQKSKNKGDWPNYDFFSSVEKGYGGVYKTKIEKVELKKNKAFGAKVYVDYYSYDSFNCDGRYKQDFYLDKIGEQWKIVNTNLLNPDSYKLNPDCSSQKRKLLNHVKDAMDVKVTKLQDSSFLHLEKPDFDQFEVEGFNDTLITRLLNYKKFKGKTYIVTSTKSIGHECHGCAPSLSFITLNRKEIPIAYYVGREGNSGDPPRVKWYKLGKNNYAFMTKELYIGQGYRYYTNEIYDIKGTAANEVLDLLVKFNNKGTFQKKFGWEANVSRVFSNKRHYKLEVHKKGTYKKDNTDEIAHFDSTIIYEFNGERYVRK